LSPEKRAAGWRVAVERDPGSVLLAKVKGVITGWAFGRAEKAPIVLQCLIVDIREMAFLTPQEKKRLSYERDRRNAYGENGTVAG
jgi:hypothetical protein